MVTLEGANTYHGERLSAETWQGETEEKRQQALNSAVFLISRYKTEMGESDFECAVYEQAVFMLGSRYEMQSNGVTSFSLSGISESYAVTGRPLDIAPLAWNIIKYGTDGLRGGAKHTPIWIC